MFHILIILISAKKPVKSLIQEKNKKKATILSKTIFIFL